MISDMYKYIGADHLIKSCDTLNKVILVLGNLEYRICKAMESLDSIEIATGVQNDVISSIDSLHTLVSQIEEYIILRRNSPDNS